MKGRKCVGLLVFNTAFSLFFIFDRKLKNFSHLRAQQREMGSGKKAGKFSVPFNTCDGEGCKIMQPPLGSKPALTKGVELGTAFHVIKFPPRIKTQAPPFPSSFAPDPIFHLLHDSTIYPPPPSLPPYSIGVPLICPSSCSYLRSRAMQWKERSRVIVVSTAPPLIATKARQPATLTVEGG